MMEKEKEYEDLLITLLILLITIVTGTILIMACGADPAEAIVFSSAGFLEHRQLLQKFL